MSLTTYNITVTIEDFKTTINNAKHYPGLKTDSKSQKMLLFRPIPNLDRYESAMTVSEQVEVKLKIYGQSIYNPHSAHRGKSKRYFVDLKNKSFMLYKIVGNKDSIRTLASCRNCQKN